MRVLIVGAGVAGLTLHAYLHKRGIEADVIERASTTHHTGYSLALFPIGSNVLHGLDVHQKFLDISQPVRHYRYGNGKGELVHSYDFDHFVSRYGPYQMLGRGELLQLLLEAGDQAKIRFNTVVEDLQQNEAVVQVSFSDGTEGEYDLVVGADGIHSSIRRLVFGQAAHHDTGWGGWMWWLDGDLPDHDTVTEYWYVGRFIGVYPAKEKVACFVGGPDKEMKVEGNTGVASHLKSKFKTFEGPAAAVLDSLEHQDAPFYWSLSDVRAEEWVKGRVVLLGDSGGGFLPTAGIGASMALESAAVLNDVLLRTGPAYLPRALERFQKRRQKRVFKAQDASRQLAKIMTVSSAPVAWGRDFLMKFATIEQMLKDVADLMDSPA